MSEQTNTPGTALVPAEPEAMPRTITKIDEWEDAYRSIRTSIPTDTDDGRAAYVMALAGSTKYLKHAVGSPLLVKDWLLHIVDRTDDVTGEVTAGLRLVLLLADGTSVSTGSGPFIENWAHVARMFANVKPWPQLEITVVARPRKKGTGEYLQLQSIRKVEQGTTRKPK